VTGWIDQSIEEAIDRPSETKWSKGSLNDFLGHQK